MKDSKFLEAIRELPCLACGNPAPNQAHHIKHRGSGGSDDAHNLLPLCAAHHAVGNGSWHVLGAIKFCERYPWVKAYMEVMGWEFKAGKIWHPKHSKNVGVSTAKL